MDKKKLMIIDGNSIINRAYYGIKAELTTSKGLHTNAIYGFLNIFLKYFEEENPEYVCVAFDMKAPTFRHESYEQYKANRKGMPDELAEQMPVLKQVLNAMNVKMFEKEGYEADDIIGTVSLLCENAQMECIIVTGDRDSLQLASENTIIKLPITKGGLTDTYEYNDKKVIEKYGVTPVEFIDVKALMGDKSDNVPGVKGVGEKTALSLIQKFKSVENIYANIDSSEIRKNVKNKLTEDKEMAFLSKELVTIDRNVPGNINIDDCIKKEYDKESLIKIFNELQFKSFIQKLGLQTVEEAVNSLEGKHIHITTSTELKELSNDIIKNKEMTYILYIDDSGYEKNIVSMSLLVDENTAAYIDINTELTKEDIIKILKPLFESENIKKIGHKIKDDITVLNSYGIKLRGIYFDTMIGSYIINPSRTSYNIDEVASEFLRINIPSESDVFGKGKKRVSIQYIDKDMAVNFACSQVLVLPKLARVLKNKIKENNQEKLYYDIELPLVEVLADMQITGFKVDRKKLLEFSQMLDSKINKIGINIYKAAGEQFNINSPKQLGVILFEKLKLPVIKKTKTGYSTNIDVLEKLKGKHEIIEMIIEYRQFVKLKSTYADGLANVANPNNDKIYSNFNQTVTVTGRISSTEPNLQNIPVKTELGREIRKMFIASNEDYVLVDADYSQIELRVLAHIADDPNMIEAFNNNEDIHTKTASQVFHVPENEVTPLMRSNAKAVNFGIVYGIGEFSLSQDLGISIKEAKKYIEGYLNHYGKVKKYMDDIVEEGKEKGYVTTLFNRRRYLPELQSKNFMKRSFGKRVAMNTPIQGSAADIIKIAMVNVHKRLNEMNMKSKLILQVHDELIIETHKDEVDKIKQILKEEMENAIELNVPLKIDTGVGSSWYDAK